MWVMNPSRFEVAAGGYTRCAFSCSRTNGKFYEFDESDMSTLQTVTSISSDPRGMGGTLNNVWSCDATADNNYELDPADLTQVQAVADATSFSGTGGIGGGDTEVWRNNFDEIHELDPADLTSVRGPTTLPGTLKGYYGVGGDDTVIWGGNNSDAEIVKIDPSDFSEITAYSEISEARGCGGGADTLWNADDGTLDKIYELDVTDGSEVQSVAFPSGATQIFDVGGK